MQAVVVATDPSGRVSFQTNSIKQDNLTVHTIQAQCKGKDDPTRIGSLVSF
jgi:hypothetical protein